MYPLTVNEWNRELRKRFGEDTTVTLIRSGHVRVSVPAEVSLGEVAVYVDRHRPVGSVFELCHLPKW